MQGAIEAAGDAVTGGLVARAVEPAHGEGAAAGHGTCLNCGAALIGAHCHQCGQKAHVHRTLHEYGHDLLHGVFHFEGKVWRTLPMLAFKPGELTRRYIRGERAKFVSPLALFLFSVFLLFAVVGGLAGSMHMPDVKANAEQAAGLQSEIGARQARLADLQRQIAAERKAGGTPTALESQASDLSREIAVMQGIRTYATGSRSASVDLDIGSPTLRAALAKAQQNPSLLLYKLQTSAYKYSWVLIPLSVPFLWLLFAHRRDLKLYDHAIFVTYSLTFMMLLVVVLTVLSAIGVPEGPLAAAALIAPPLHMHKQLRGAYGVSRAGGLWRTAALVLFAAVVLIAFLLALLALGVLG